MTSRLLLCTTKGTDASAHIYLREEGRENTRNIEFAQEVNHRARLTFNSLLALAVLDQ